MVGIQITIFTDDSDQIRIDLRSHYGDDATAQEDCVTDQIVTNFYEFMEKNAKAIQTEGPKTN